MLSRINYNLEAPQERERMLTQSDMICVVLISPVLRTMTSLKKLFIFYLQHIDYVYQII